MPNHWSITEVEAAVEVYFNMLRLELSNQKYNKAEHRRALMKRLNNRSNGSVELKHQNISAVLNEMGLPFINGYKPRFNYQRRLLPPVIIEYLRSHPELRALFQADVEKVPAVPPVEDFLFALEHPPAKEEALPAGIAEAQPIYNPFGVNYLEREAQNQSLGDAGEQYVINFERARLIYAGKEALADRVEQVSVTVGPTAGFDILSFEENGSDRFIEAKTTKYGKSTPFYVTANELSFSQKNSLRYFLYRVFKFRNEPRLFTLQGHLQEQCLLQPTLYQAKPA